jgi:hypothetical protein
MPSRDATYRIDPIDPGQIGPRFSALIDRFVPVLDVADVTALRGLIECGDHATAYARLDALTDDGTISVDTALLVELVLLGQAIRTG